MKEILDYKEENRKSELFTWTTILSSIVAFICFGSMMNLFSGTITASESLQSPSMLIVRVTQIMTAVSIITIITSYVRKEPKTWKTWIAVIMSFILFILVFGSIGFYYFIELTK